MMECQDIYLRHFSADGQPLDSASIVNSTVINRQEVPEIAVLADGGYVVVWHQSFDDDYLQRYDSEGNAQGTEVRVNTYTFHNQFIPSVAALQDGGFVVTWASFQDGSGVNGSDLAQKLHGVPAVPITS